MHEIIATACIVQGEDAQIVTLNTFRQIKIYQEGQKLEKFFTNIQPESYDFDVPFLFP